MLPTRRQLCRFIRTIHSFANEQVTTNNANSLQKEHIELAIKAEPTLSSFTLDSWQKSHGIFLTHGINTDNFVQIIKGNPMLLSQDPIEAIKIFEAWRSCQFGEKFLLQLITKYPRLLNINSEEKLLEKTTYLRTYVGSIKNVWKLIMNSPRVILDNEKIIDEKFNYLIHVMHLEIPEIVKSEVFSFSLDEIRCRHVFLKRLGIFKTRNKKSNSNELSKNPPLYRIMENSKNEFATKVAGCTLLEFEVFEELYKRELEKSREDQEENDLLDDDDDDDNFTEFDKKKNRPK